MKIGGGVPAASFFALFFKENITKDEEKEMKYKIFTVIALLGVVLLELFGGWDRALQTLMIFMAVDWITGGILLPGVFGKSPKSPNGALESRAGWKGLCRKVMTLFYVLIGAQLDNLLGIDYVRDAVCIGFIANETLSIIENAGLMGIPLPEGIKKAVDILQTHAEVNGNE